MKQTQLSYPTPSKLSPPQSASFKTTPALTDAAPRIHTLRDGELVLYKRPGSRVWQYRYKLFTGQWVRVSTGKTVLEHAIRVATDSYDEARYRERLGLAPVQKSFADIARVTVEELRRDLAAGTGKKIFVDYISIIERYFVPFFGERHLHNIRHQHIAEFERWRNHKMGRQPKSSTLMNFASAFSRVCNTAIQRGWLSERVPLPKMSRKGEKGKVRPAFTAEEVAALRVFMAAWEQKGTLEFDRLQRPLLCDYVEFLLLTGMRHGTEAMHVRWQDCEWYEVDGVRYLRVRVSGKTGERYLIGQGSTFSIDTNGNITGNAARYIAGAYETTGTCPITGTITPNASKRFATVSITGCSANSVDGEGIALLVGSGVGQQIYIGSTTGRLYTLYGVKQ